MTGPVPGWRAATAHWPSAATPVTPRWAKAQVEYGLICCPEGRPVAVEVFAGNTADPRAFISGAEGVRERSGLDDVVMVGDRGMVTTARIEALKGDGRARLGDQPTLPVHRPSTSPSQPSRSASAMRATTLSRISTSRARWAGSGQSIGQRKQTCSGCMVCRKPWHGSRPRPCAAQSLPRNPCHSSSVGVRYSSLERRRDAGPRKRGEIAPPHPGKRPCSPWWC